jgi:hypothetical protein
MRFDCKEECLAAIRGARDTALAGDESVVEVVNEVARKG